ncbi:hypothetical protein ACWDMY_34110 [Streptomyces globisporus]
MAEHDTNAPPLFELGDVSPAPPTAPAIWTLCDREARATVNGLGLPYGRKSRKITPPRVEFSRRDYLRGVIDADGSVGHTGQGLPFVSLTTASAPVGGTSAGTPRR